MTDLLESAICALSNVTKIGSARLVRGDTFRVLPLLPSGSVDLVFADPPYYLSNGGSSMSGGARVAVDKGDWDASAGLRVDHEFHRKWLRSCQRILRPEGSLWVSGTQHCIFSIGWAMGLMGWRIINVVTWQKPNPPPNLGTRCLTHSTESIIWASPNHREPQMHVFNYDEAKAANEGKQLKDVWTFPAPPASEKTHGRHPAQKPLALLERIIDLSTAPGAVVLDPFMGSGTTGLAAHRLGRRFVGVEQDPIHHKLATARNQALIDGDLGLCEPALSGHT